MFRGSYDDEVISTGCGISQTDFLQTCILGRRIPGYGSVIRAPCIANRKQTTRNGVLPLPSGFP